MKCMAEGKVEAKIARGRPKFKWENNIKVLAGKRRLYHQDKRQTILDWLILWSPMSYWDLLVKQITETLKHALRGNLKAGLFMWPLFLDMFQCQIGCEWCFLKRYRDRPYFKYHDKECWYFVISPHVKEDHVIYHDQVLGTIYLEHARMTRRCSKFP